MIRRSTVASSYASAVEPPAKYRLMARSASVGDACGFAGSASRRARQYAASRPSYDVEYRDSNWARMLSA
jgi:hypothetical protein